MGTVNGQPEQCPVCAGTPSVLVAVGHRALRDLTVELLDREHGCWRAHALAAPSQLAASVAAARPDLVVIDAADFGRCCRDLLGSFPPGRVVVIGPEPGAAYEHAALGAGAGGWVSSDRVGEDLSTSMRAALGCTHGPCPPPAH